MITFKTSASQGSERAPMRQVYVPKKVEAPVIPPPRARPQTVITIGSMEAPIINHDGPIITKETPAQKQDEVPKEVAGNEKERAEIVSKYHQPMWCPRGLNKTQRRKLQCARHKQQKREMLAKMGGEVLNPEHVESSSKGQNDAAATGQSAKPTLMLSQSTKPTAPVLAGLDMPKSVKLTLMADTVLEAPEST
jgi:hypothetical protein